MEEESIDLDVVDCDDINAIKIIGGACIDNDDSGGADTKGRSGLRGAVDREIRGQSGQGQGNGDGATRPGQVCNIEDEEVGSGTIGDSLVNGVTKGAGPTVPVGGRRECVGQG